jgi:predicted nuclease of predicted toxin-antitoxin system
MAKIKFHLDENITLAIANGLRRRGIDVTTTPEQGMIGQTDEKQLEFAISQARVIFTQDTDFLRLHHAGFSHQGLIYCPQTSKSIGEILQGLILIWEVIDAKEMHNHLEYL